MASPDQPGSEPTATEAPPEDTITPIHFGVLEPHEMRVLRNEDGESTGVVEHKRMGHIEQSTTTVGLPERMVEAILSGRRDYDAVMTGLDDLSAYREVMTSLQHHSALAPAWCHSPHPELGEKIAAFFGLEHEGAKRSEWDTPSLPPVAGGSPYLVQHYHDPEDWWREVHEPGIGTVTGRDRVLEAFANNGTQPSAMQYVALSEDNTAIAEGSGEEAGLATATTLTGEITTGGVGRAAAVVSHTAKAKTSLVKITFTSTAGGKAVNKFALFNAASAGDMGVIVKLAAAMNFNASGDKGEIQETLEVTAFT